MEQFEDILASLSKPTIPYLKHQDRVLEQIMRAKDKTALSWWWLAIPVYVIFCFLMKRIFSPGSLFVVEVRNYVHHHPWAGAMVFLVLPVLSAIINCGAIQHLYFSCRRPFHWNLLRPFAFNIVWIILSIMILIASIIFKIKIPMNFHWFRRVGILFIPKHRMG